LIYRRFSRRLGLGLSIVAFAGSFLAVSGCERRKPLLVSDRQVLALPTKDEVALINGRALSFAQFEEIHRKLGKPSLESTLWICLGAMVLQDDLKQTQGRLLEANYSIDIASFAAGATSAPLIEPAWQAYSVNSAGAAARPIPPKEELRAKIEALLNRSEIVRNPHALSEVR
jgi:hypothetical protein